MCVFYTQHLLVKETFAFKSNSAKLKCIYGVNRNDVYIKNGEINTQLYGFIAKYKLVMGIVYFVFLERNCHHID